MTSCDSSSTCIKPVTEPSFAQPTPIVVLLIASLELSIQHATSYERSFSPRASLTVVLLSSVTDYAQHDFQGRLLDPGHSE